ncbi:glycosyltransferase family 2 protein [Paenibacillus thiaminolyticus]|uniref:glycosyltransferase family 2 protein n=1 Tax=Paenibacillus thiaminolyticus TaxID=49283 RepID=UPI00232E4E92|nr:glycosyltransferase family 2 protein [Paenibacillus thiaminolyticus]WCF07860.1 glycosyltransferase family 2 protein [Paenibacillus thiaminolyticus]
MKLEVKSVMGEQRVKVQILVSTYNGEKYLAEQLDSLLKQSHSYFLITIRDDGSSDSTTAIIREYVSHYPHKIEAFFENNVGVIASFFELLTKHVHKDTDYICLCDQDDVWMSDKLERGLHALGGHTGNMPMMHITSTQMVNDMLQPLNCWPPAPRRGPSFFNALIENIAVGATMMINRPTIEMMQRHVPHPEHIVMHDWWAYLVVSAFGKVIYDEKPSILYRQHQRNVVGGQNGIIETLEKKWGNYRKHCESKIYWSQAKEFERCWGELLPMELRGGLQQFLLSGRTLTMRIHYALTTPLYRQSNLDNFVFRLMMIRGDILK